MTVAPNDAYERSDFIDVTGDEILELAVSLVTEETEEGLIRESEIKHALCALGVQGDYAIGQAGAVCLPLCSSVTRVFFYIVVES